MISVKRPKPVPPSLPLDPVTDELVDRCRSGDEAAWGLLVRATYREVYTLCLRILRDPHDAADATQDAYLKAWRGLAGFRGDAAFSTWMFRIATNAALSKHRSRTRRRSHEADTDDAAMERLPGSASTEDSVAVRLDVQAVASALEALPEQQRVVLVMRDVYGMAMAEIAGGLGITETAAKVRVHRARRRLRDLVFEGAGDEGGGDRDEL